MHLLERDGCLRQLEDAAAEALAGQGRVVLVSGEAGIGKTSLLQQFVQQPNTRARLRVLWGSCETQFTPRPLGPLHDIASQLKGPLAHLLTSGADRSSVFAGVLDELRARPTVGVFEDVHWADDATFDLLAYLARRLAQCATLLVVTYRDDELSARHPLRLLLGDLATSPITRRVALQPLSQEAVRTLVGSRELDVAALHSRSAGNPFFVSEVLANPDVDVPPTVRDAVLARVARVSTAAYAVLQAAAVLGPRIESTLLQAMGFGDPAAIDECAACGMLMGQRDVLSFRHELTRQAILETLSPVLLVVLHRRALQALRTLPDGHEDPARLAHHAEAAGDHSAVLEFATAAAGQAARATAHREAAALYALALARGAALAPAERARLLEAYARECNPIDQRAEAIAARREAVALWADR